MAGAGVEHDPTRGRRPPLCWPASQSDSTGAFSSAFFGDLLRAFFTAAGRGGSVASRASRNAFSLAMLSSTALAAIS